MFHLLEFSRMLSVMKRSQSKSQFKMVQFSLLRNFNINLGDWVLVSYDWQKFPGEVTNITGLDFEATVMQKSCGAFWKWVPKEDRIFYQKENVIQKLNPPEVAGSRGQFKYKNLQK